MSANKDLHLDTSERHHRIEWRMQRVGWALIGLVLLAALSGLFGSAHFGQTRVESPDGGLRADYMPFTRHQTAARLELRIAPPARGTVEVWLPVDYLRRMNLRRAEPEPERVAARGDRQVFTFNVADPAQAAQVTFHFQPEHFGRVRGAVGLVDGPALEFRQLVYP